MLNNVVCSLFPPNEPNNLSIWLNWWNLYGIFCIDGNALSSCAEQMPMFPAASLIMTGIIVIELLSHCCACAELHSLTAARICQRALGRPGDSWWKVLSDHSNPSNSANYTLLNHLWSPLFLPKKPPKKHTHIKAAHKHVTSSLLYFNFFASPSWTLQLPLAGKTWTKMLSPAPLLLPSLMSLAQVLVNESPLLCARTNFEGK